ncbi:hypothetical protein ABID22_002100 [Pontibacter aydingkolensis]|uniref:Glycosyltransferase RgtA/B/C/D-like domain-containing protein n=1 Tax=Pontibacter aydingkolensis TaxID=1911536 RepID=A0ABS7CVJ4_9BACT|nr:hypothetical protein [Pontibacter aydingkolensis]MBW7467716.1 hypothetical protein [Pontibacter aydingkolensis]
MEVFLYLLNALLICGLISLLYRNPGLQSIKKHLLPALVLKLLAGILLGLLYHHYYHEGDTLTFKNASLILSEYALQNPAGYVKLILFNEFESEAFRATVPFSRLPDFSNSFFFTKLLSLLNLLTNSQYYLNSLYFSLFSFWGTAALVATLVKHFPKYKSAAMLAFLYFPSVVFWSSGVLKDAILFGSMCWVFAVAVELSEGKRLRILNWLLLPFILYLFIRIKFFLALILLPLLVLFLLIRFIAKRSGSLKQIKSQIAVLLIGFSALALVGLYLAVNINDAFFLRNLVYTYEGILELSQERPHISFSSLEPTVGSILVNAPKAFLSAVFRPFIWEAVNVLYLLMSLENLLILALAILATFSLFKNGLKQITLLQVCFVLMIICFGVIIGLTTPNFGTLSRYRIVLLPFLVYLLLQNQYIHKLLAKLRL